MRSSTRRKNTQKKNQKEILELKNTVNALTKSITASTANGTNQAEERNSELKNISLETTKSEKQKEKKMNRNEESVPTLLSEKTASLKLQEEKKGRDRKFQ